MKLSVIIPCYNERDTIAEIRAVVRRELPEDGEIILVDDFSTDGSRELLQGELAESGCRIYEAGISYHGRTYQDGKKIGWRDGSCQLLALHPLHS